MDAESKNILIQIATHVIALLVGSCAGYWIGIKQSNKQTQKAGNYSTQTQIGNISNNNQKDNK